MAAGSFAWRTDHQGERVGSALLEVRLVESLDHLATRFSVTVPQHGRHRAAIEALRKWNRTDRPVDLSDHEELRRLTEAHRLAWETFLITVAAIEDRRNVRTPFTADKLDLMMGGDLVAEGRSGAPRDTQFELFLAAMLRLPGVTVARGEPDLLMTYGTREVALAAKRIRSLNVDQVQKNARDAAQQIARRDVRGWIALNLDSRFRGIDYTHSDDALLNEFTRTFNSINAALRRPALKPHVLGFIQLGYVHSWHPPLGGSTAPRLHWATPLRWHGLVDASEDEELFHRFTGAWSDRWTARLKTLSSRNFTGLL